MALLIMLGGFVAAHTTPDLSGLGALAHSLEKSLGGQLSAGTYSRTVLVDQRERSYDLFIPDGRNGNEPAPLILAFHAALSTPEQFARISRLNKVAGARGYVVAYARGVARTWNAGDCCGLAKRQDIDDVAFVRAMIADITTAVDIDRHRIFATGWSNGGKLAYRLACELSDQIAAVAVVGTGLGVSRCQPGRPVPVLHFHGTEDRIHPYRSGTGRSLGSTVEQMGAVETIERWRELNVCRAEATPTYQNGSAECQAYTDCRAGATVELCTITGMGHQWPGSALPFRRLLGAGSDDISATDALVAFFEKHPLPAPSP